MQPGPLISVVLPVYGVPEYLGDCLDSVLGQAPGDTEVIAVDDASPDACGQILDTRARLDPRLKVIHLTETGGPGNARNAGCKSASGDYVWFVDADDLIADGAFAEICAKLRRDQPDVLLIDYEDYYAGGATRPGPGAALLRAAPAGTFTLASRPEMINATMTVWSKVIRRAFLAEIGVTFPPGIDEDVPVSCAVLLSARRISALGRVCYRYRRSRRGSFMVTTSDRHFDIFDSYQAVFDLLPAVARRSGEPVTDAVMTALFERAIWHYTTILAAGGAGLGPARIGGLVPRRARRMFFTRMHEDFRRWRPAGYRYPPGARGVKFRLVARNAYLTYSLLEPVNQLRVLISELVRTARSRSSRSAPRSRHPG